jgi:twinkle protein
MDSCCPSVSTFVAHEPCPKCGSQDNFARYDDGHGYCFSAWCGYYEHGNDNRRESEDMGGDRHTDMSWSRLSGVYADLPSRKLKESTLKFWQYQIADDAHVMNYKDERGELKGQKLRKANKQFSWRGEGSDLLYGMWLWQRGKSITITEGELDALSVSQSFENRWPVVSLPGGTGSVNKCIKRCYEYLSAYDRIVLMFDMDAPGRRAVEDAVALLPAGKVYIANLPEKDANEVLVKHGPGAIVKAFWDAKLYRPDGIVSGSELSLDDLKNGDTRGYTLRLPKLNDQIMGLRRGEITLFTAGSGVGKSTLVRQLCYEMHLDHKLTIGNVYLEENNRKTAQAYIALHNDVPLGRLRYDPAIITPDQWLEGYETTIKDRMWFYNHFGSLESSRLISKLHYMATVLKTDFIALDHVTIVTSGLESSQEGERKDIDILMTRLRSLVEETGVGILAVCHLKRVKGKEFNEGSEVSLTDLRGSAALEQLSDNVISMERDQQSVKARDVSLLRVLKCRETGDTGPSDTVIYNRETGKLVEKQAAKAFKEPIKEAVPW